ncbi:formylmethanofuran--tetrahydromethanopterin N-formyltransferase [Candidatus Bathyarchaeota archaeon]|nr:formylmethanofuran--tetrahydromethanopterin N-formyltransferase [Candidatus Bathyarchaeota archaeon]
MRDTTQIEDTYAEAFEGILSRVVLTADEEETLRKAAIDATAAPSIVLGRIEGGIETWLDKRETPDKRTGALLQFWGGIDPNKPLADSLKSFEIELSYRIRQDILVKPFTALFNALPQAKGQIDMMKRVGHCGDGYEWVEKRYGRELIIVPTMVPDFMIEHYLGYRIGIMGANFWILCKTKKALMQSGKEALQAIDDIEGVVTPFGVCSAGSKPETRYPWIGPTTNHTFCPSLRQRLGNASEVPENVHYIPEIVINGISMKTVKRAMKAGIDAAAKVRGVIRISAGNYGGQLGKHKIFLKDVLSSTPTSEAY